MNTHRRGILIVGLLLLGLGALLLWPQLQRLSGLTREDFEFVQRGMTLDEIARSVGEPKPGGGPYLYDSDLRNGDQAVLRFSVSEGLQGGWIAQTDGSRVNLFSGEFIPVPTFEEFSFLEPRIAYEEVVRRVGEPVTELGSGRHMAIYELVDGREVTLMLGPRVTQTEIQTIVTDALIGPNDEGAHVSMFYEY